MTVMRCAGLREIAAGILVVVAGLFATGCRLEDEGSAQTESHAEARPWRFALIPTDAGQSRYGLRAGDTLSEISAETVPAKVRAAAVQAEQSPPPGPPFDSQCTRYFRGHDTYVVWFGGHCVLDETIGPHSEGVLVLDSTGASKDSVVRWPKLEDYFDYALR